jgi:hypothetical protein
MADASPSAGAAPGVIAPTLGRRAARHAHQYAAISVWDWSWWRVALPLLIFVVFNVLYITTGFLYLSVVSV